MPINKKLFKSKSNSGISTNNNGVKEFFTTLLNSRVAKNAGLAFYGVLLVFSTSCNRPTDKTYDYSANGNDWDKTDIMADLKNDKVGTITIKAMGDFQNVEAPEASKDAKEVYGYFIDKSAIKAGGNFNFASITQGAYDTLRGLGYTVSGDIVQPVIPHDTTFTWTPMSGFTPNFTLDDMDVMNADPNIRYVILEPGNWDWAGKESMKQILVGLVYIHAYSDKIKAGTNPVSNCEIYRSDSTKLFGELRYVYGQNITVIADSKSNQR